MSETVLEQIAKLALGDDRLTEEEQAVIEAAKAFREAWLIEHDTEERRQTRMRVAAELLEAIEALQEVE